MLGVGVRLVRGEEQSGSIDAESVRWCQRAQKAAPADFVVSLCDSELATPGVKKDHFSVYYPG